MNSNNKIIVNATAADSGGSLTILKQFIEAIPDDQFEYILFVYYGVNLFLDQANIRIIQKNVKTLRKRFFWDAFGIKTWLKENNIKPLATISLQNTNFRTNRSIPNFIYYHQSIPFFDHSWNPRKKEERLLWFYKEIYPYFVKMHINKNTDIFVQINYIRDSFTEVFNFPIERIHIISPKISLPVLEDAIQTNLDNNRLNLFYPATSHTYKNHSIILKALNNLDRELQKQISLHLTCEKHEIKSLDNDDGDLFQINFMGQIPFNVVLGMYKEADALLFPSFIETFGLPLIEAASFGMPIIASDLPYSHEVLKTYEGVSFVTYNNDSLWAEEISKLFSLNGRRYPPIKMEISNSWQELFRILKFKIQIQADERNSFEGKLPHFKWKRWIRSKSK